MHHPVYLYEMKDYANKVYSYKDALKKYWNLLEPSEEKNAIYQEYLIGIENIVAEVRLEIQSYESDYYDPGNEYKKYMMFERNTARHNEMERKTRSIEKRYRRIKEMYEKAKEIV